MHFNEKHGHAKPGKRSGEYRSWESARSRCRNPNDPFFAKYGGRGIRFDPVWDKFPDFYAAMGPRPEGTTLDRIDTDGDYTPGNCRWATASEQARNKRSNRMVVWRGRLVTMVALVEQTGLRYGLLHDRIVRRGWSVERAVTEEKRQWPRAEAHK